MSDWNRINEPYQEDKWLNKVKQLEAENKRLREAGQSLYMQTNHAQYCSYRSKPSECDCGVVAARLEWREACDE